MNHGVMRIGLREQMESPYGRWSGGWWRERERERERNGVKHNPKVLGGKAEITENQLEQGEDRALYRVDLMVTRGEVISN